MTAPKIAFVYLLNRMENAASAKVPSKAGFSEHRNAVVEHVNRIEAELADARAALQVWMRYFGGDHETAVMAIVEDGSTLTHAQEVTKPVLAKQG